MWICLKYFGNILFFVRYQLKFEDFSWDIEVENSFGSYRILPIIRDVALDLEGRLLRYWLMQEHTTQHHS
jgi:hypothetical protein